MTAHPRAPALLRGGDFRMPAPRPWLRAREVADRLHVDPKTVTRWARQGRLAHRRTLGGHRRYDPEYIEQLVRAQTYQP
jgi:excisionase family DNA binding protein